LTEFINDYAQNQSPSPFVSVVLSGDNVYNVTDAVLFDTAGQQLYELGLTLRVEFTYKDAFGRRRLQASASSTFDSFLTNLQVVVAVVPSRSPLQFILPL
jgi:hypothetical protein